MDGQMSDIPKIATICCFLALRVFAIATDSLSQSVGWFRDDLGNHTTNFVSFHITPGENLPNFEWGLGNRSFPIAL